MDEDETDVITVLRFDSKSALRATTNTASRSSPAMLSS